MYKRQDVPGVRVGHTTVDAGSHHTGVTVILPRQDIYNHRCTAAAHVINGFGKTAGLVPVSYTHLPAMGDWAATR